MILRRAEAENGVSGLRINTADFFGSCGVISVRVKINDLIRGGRYELWKNIVSLKAKTTLRNAY